MIRKLRRKFILITMLLVSLVLLIVFIVICFSSYRRMQSDSLTALQHALSRDEKLLPKLDLDKRKPGEPSSILPVFCVQLDESGNILSVQGETVEPTDELVSYAVQGVSEQGRDSGILHSLSLRYQRIQTAGGAKIAFVDITSERQTMMNLILTSFLVGIGGLAAFFFISLFLANWALRPVELAWQQQRQFIADASHELKTPLTVILANIGILQSHRADTIEAQLKWVEYTKQEAIHMKKLVDDLLFLAKSDDGSARILYADFNLSDAVWSSLLPFESIAYEQGLTLNSEIEPNLFMKGDESQLKQLVVILLDNACKYAKGNGAITLLLKSAQDRVRLSVNNTGEPIPKEQLPHIFERFYRADDGARDRKQGGYGLGLAIAKSIVASHHGRISVTSDSVHGTTFTAEFPLERSS